MGARFSAPFQTGPGAHPASYTVDTRSLPGVKQPGRDVDPPQSSTEVEGRVELYLYSPSGPSWPVLGGMYADTNNIYDHEPRNVCEEHRGSYIKYQTQMCFS